MSEPQPTKCPKCDYVRTAGDELVMDSICPACGIVYARWQSEPVSPATHAESVKEIDIDALRHRNETQGLKPLLLGDNRSPSTEAFWGCALIYVVFVIWGWRFIANGLSSTAIMESFMHAINLPFHEFGHVLFMPFGRFMTILGGSLFQLLMPLIVLLVFVFKQRDPFAASIALWWLGQSFIDLSPYIADASFRALPLIAGMGEESHDWGNLLTMLGLLQADYTIAKTSFGIGVAILLLSMAWGAAVLFHRYRNLR